MSDWQGRLDQTDRATLERGRWAQAMGFGHRPAVLVIDCQYYMTGIRDGEQASYPYSCGATGWAAVDRMAEIVAASRRAGAPVVYTRFVLRRDGSDAGNFTRKVAVPDSDNVMWAGSHGAEIVAELAPQPGELVIDKNKASAFFGTPVLQYLIDRAVDTVIVVGGSTSNCVRATVVEANSYNFRTIVPQEAVFDRLPISHEVSLVDMNRLFADVLPTADVVGWLDGLAGSRRAAE